MKIPLAAAKSGRNRRLLVLTKSSGWQHEVIAREGDRLSYMETVITQKTLL